MRRREVVPEAKSLVYFVSSRKEADFGIGLVADWIEIEAYVRRAVAQHTEHPLQ